MTPKSNNGGPHENARRPCGSAATTAHAEAPACPRPAGTLALASLYSCSASLSSFLAFSSFVSASLSFVSISSTFSLLLALYSCSHRSRKAATTLSALTTALSPLSRARRAAAKSCQGVFAEHVCFRGLAGACLFSCSCSAQSSRRR